MMVLIIGSRVISPQVVQSLRIRAASGVCTEAQVDMADPYFRRCNMDHYETGTRLCFTREAGYNAAGWWKNPDYDRCYHLSLSYRDPPTGESRPHDHDLSEKWCREFFGDAVRWIWTEPPHSDVGKRRDTWHFRLFCDPAWQPLKPRSEVYTRRFTPAEWLSWSDRQYMLGRAL